MSNRADSALDTIASLLELADNEGAEEAERANARRMAEKLGARYSIEFASARLRASQRSDHEDKVVQRSIDCPYGGSTWTEGYVALADAMSEAFDMPIMWRGKRITLYGRRFDVELLVTLFQRLVIEQEEAAERAVRSRSEGTARQARASFRYGYRRALLRRLRKLREESAADLDREENLSAGTTALEVRDRNAQIQSEFSESLAREDLEVVNESFALKPDQRLESALRSGRRAGENAKLFTDRELARGGRELRRG